MFENGPIFTIIYYLTAESTHWTTGNLLIFVERGAVGLTMFKPISLLFNSSMISPRMASSFSFTAACKQRDTYSFKNIVIHTVCQIYIFSIESQTVTQNHLSEDNSKNFISKNINMSRYTPHVLYNRTITSW